MYRDVWSSPSMIPIQRPALCISSECNLSPWNESDIRNQGVDLGKLEEVHTLYKVPYLSYIPLTPGRTPRRGKSRRRGKRSGRNRQETSTISSLGSRPHVRLCLSLRRTYIIIIIPMAKF